MEIKRCGEVVKNGVIRVKRAGSIIEGTVEYRENNGKCTLKVIAKESIIGNAVKDPLASKRNRSFTCTWEGNETGPDAEKEIIIAAAKEFCDCFMLHFAIPIRFPITTANFKYLCRPSHGKRNQN